MEISFFKPNNSKFCAKNLVKLLHSGSSQGSRTVFPRNTWGHTKFVFAIAIDSFSASNNQSPTHKKAWCLLCVELWGMPRNGTPPHYKNAPRLLARMHCYIQWGRGYFIPASRYLHYFRAFLFQIVSWAFWFNAK